MSVCIQLSGNRLMLYDNVQIDVPLSCIRSPRISRSEGMSFDSGSARAGCLS